MATTTGRYLYGLIRTTVETEVGKGSTFRVELPVAEQHERLGMKEAHEYGA